MHLACSQSLLQWHCILKGQCSVYLGIGERHVMYPTDPKAQILILVAKSLGMPFLAML